MTEPVTRWRVCVDRGPHGLLVKATAAEDDSSTDTSLPKALWTLMEQTLTYRVVLELEAGNGLDRKLIRELSRVDRRARVYDIFGYVALRVPQGGNCGGRATTSDSYF